MHATILNAIGNTPLVEIRHLNPNPQVRILAKLESFNPGGSIKDRPALAMIADGERSGRLTSQKTVIEATSGNTGIGLALVCAVRGYRLLLTMSEAVSLERRKILAARGAQIRLTPGHLGTDGAIEEVYHLVREHPERYFMADQYNNAANWQAHYHTTAAEIWRQTDQSVSMIVATMGTGGTLMGLSRRLKEFNPHIQIVGVEPYLGHKIQGLKNMKEAYCPEIFEKERLDQKINIEDEDAFEMTRQLAKKEGLFVGMSSGAAMAIARRQARQMQSGVIVVIFPDSGERYLSTPLFAVRNTAGINLFNTAGHRKHDLILAHAKQVSMFTCGPTVDGPLDINQHRRFILADLLSRYLAFKGCDVNHVMNIIDIDDNIIERSLQHNQDPAQFAAKHLETFKTDLQTLRIQLPHAMPQTSDHMDAMLSAAEKLIQNGKAYEKLRSIYFDISRAENYGKIAGINIDQTKIGATVDLDDYEKDNPRDFTLFKRSRLSELKRGIYVKTQWGNMRPSWHIQGAAIAMKFFPNGFDLHVCSSDRVFPHHENKMAIIDALGAGRPDSHWIDANQVINPAPEPLPTIAQLTESGFTGREIRYWLLSSQYRKPLTFSIDRIDNARQALKRIDACIDALHRVNRTGPGIEIDQLIYDIKQGVVSALDDDLNTAAALAAIFKQIRIINTWCAQNQLTRANADRIIDSFREINAVLDIFDRLQRPLSPSVTALLAQREDARKRQDWKLADHLRSQLEAQGIEICDRGIQTLANPT